MSLILFLAAVVIRGAQALLDATPYLLVGGLLAGLVSAFVPPERLRRVFGGSIRGPLAAAALAVILPVCSIGAIPLLTTLRHAGMPRGAWLTLALAVGILNPISLAYGLTLLDPGALILFAVASLVPAILAGSLGPAAPEPDASVPHAIPYGPRRVVAVAWFGARQLAGPALPWIVLAVVGAGLIGAIVPHASLDMSILADDPVAPIRMMGIAPPAHVAPERAMMLTSQIVQHTCSAGAAYLLFALGAGINVGLIGLALATLGPRLASRRMLLTAALAFVIAYGFHAFMHLPGIERGDTHAFDRMTNPFATQHDLRYLGSIARKELGPPPVAPLAALAVVLSVGLAARYEPTRRRVETALLRPVPASAESSLWSRALPTRVVVLGGLAAALLSAAALVFVYYPAPDETFDDMRIVRADALASLYSQSNPVALRSLRAWETLNHKLVVGTLLRRGSLPEPQRLASRQLGDTLEELHQALVAGASPDEARRLARTVEDAYARLRRAYGRP